jgi:hypothetical protein
LPFAVLEVLPILVGRTQAGSNRQQVEDGIKMSKTWVIRTVSCLWVCLAAAQLLLWPGRVSAQSTDAHVYVDVVAPPELALSPSPNFITLSLVDPRRYENRYAGQGICNLRWESSTDLYLRATRSRMAPGWAFDYWMITPYILSAPGGAISVAFGANQRPPAPLAPGEYHVSTLYVFDMYGTYPAGSWAGSPLLPTATVDGAWQFRFDITEPGKPMFIDPLVAVGYDYFVDSGPRFSSVLLPSVGDNLYDLWLWDNAISSWMDSGTNLTGGSQYDFASGGLDRFRILGIEASAGLDPQDDTAFVTGLWFTDTGSVTMRQVPISFDTETIPAPGALALLSIGLVGLRFVRRKLA